MELKNSSGVFTLSHPQKRIWYDNNIYSDSSIFNIGGALRIKGEIDLERMEKVINIILDNNEAFRLRFILHNNEISQFISDYEYVNFKRIHFSSHENFISWAELDFKQGFDLLSGVLFNCVLCTNPDNQSYVYLKMHHIISDGWAFNIVVKQICEIYNNLEGNEYKYVKYSYIDFIKNEQKYLKSKRYENDKKYFSEKFDTLPENLVNMRGNSNEGKRIVYKLNKQQSENIKSVLDEYKISLNTFFISVYLLYFTKKHQIENITVGVPILNRSGNVERNTIGMFTSTMPFRYNVDMNMSLERMIIDVNNELIKSIRHQKYPYDLLVQNLELRKHEQYGLFQFCINTYNTRFDYKIDGLETEVFEFFGGKQSVPIQLIVKEWGELGGITLAFDYKTSEYSSEDVEIIYNNFIVILEKIVTNRKIEINRLDLLNSVDKEDILLKFNLTKEEYPKEKTIYELFEEQVDRTPNHVALFFNNKRLTYKELNEKSNQLARLLKKKGVNTSTKVGLITKHSFETIIGLLAIIKAGAVYVPIDVTYPIDRINYMIHHSNLSLIVTNCDIKENVIFEGEYINLDNADLYTGEKGNLGIHNKMNDLIYVIYTSGSTGNPKGVMIEHKGLTNYIWWAKKKYIRSVDEIFALYSSLSFDLTVTSIFTPLISGNTINIYYDDDYEFILYKILEENVVNIIKLTPAHLSLLLDSGIKYTSVKRFILGGENLKCELAAKVYEGSNGRIEIFNEYGPTETVVGCMFHKYDYIADNEIYVPIGIPAANVQIYVLDKYLNPVPYDTVGQLFISGDGVARGYLANSELTNSAFIPDPFTQGNIMYKTGDSAKRRRDNKLEYIGRLDNQVKIKGYRIELGEIESKLLAIVGINEAVVLMYQDVNGEKKICAYITGSSNLSIQYVRNELFKFLPYYMIPTYIQVLSKLPLTSNGKVDTKYLLSLGKNEISTTEKVSASNEMERVLLKEIKEILLVENIGVNDNFYELGGDSIKAIQISSRLSNQGLTLKVKDILTNNHIDEIAACIEKENKLLTDQNLCTGELGKTPIMEWFFEQKFINYNHWNQSILLKIKSNISTDIINITLEKLIEHHDSLRINYDLNSGRLYYNNLNIKVEAKSIDLTSLDYGEQEKRIIKEGVRLKSSIDISNTLLFNACIFQLGVDDNRILLTAHHLIIDGVSWRIFLEDFNLLITQQINGLELKLPLKAHSVRDWIGELEEYGNTIHDREILYWNEVIQKQNPLEVDFDLGIDTVGSVSVIKEVLNENETRNLLNSGKETFGITTNEMLIIALVIALNDVNGGSSFSLELENHGRREISNIDISRTIGWFTNMYPVNLCIEQYDLENCIKSIKDQLRKIPEEGFNFGILKYMKKSITENSRKVIRFNYLGDFSASLHSQFREAFEETGGESCNENHLTYLIEVIAMIIDGKLNVSINYSRNKFEHESIKNLSARFLIRIRELLFFCNSKNTREFTSTDFDAVDISQEDLDFLLG